jgi:predicted Zn-dependent protease
LAAALVLNAQNQPAPRPDRGVNFYSTEKEAALGAQLAADFRRDHLALDNAAARDYIQQMGERLARTMPQPSLFQYRFELMQDFNGTFLDPAALPGGYIFVPAGLMLAANDEAELAGTLAHAMAHVLARHGTREATKGEIAQLATIPLIYWGGFAGYGANQNAAEMLPVGFLQFQKAMESEADALAVKMTSSAGYDPEGLARYVGRVQQDGPQPRLSGIPPRADRVRNIERAIQALPAQSYAASGDFARLQEEVRRLAPAPPKPPTLQR